MSVWDLFVSPRERTIQSPPTEADSFTREEARMAAHLVRLQGEEAMRKAEAEYKQWVDKATTDYYDGSAAQVAPGKPRVRLYLHYHDESIHSWYVNWLVNNALHKLAHDMSNSHGHSA